MKIIDKYSDQEKNDAALQLSLEHLQNTQDILTLVLLAGIIWFVLYMWAMWRCVHCLKTKHNTLWESLHKPTTFSRNFKTLGFVFSDRVKSLPQNERWQFNTLRWLAFIGIVYVLAVVVALMVLL